MSGKVMNSGSAMSKGSPNAAKKCFEFGHRNKAGEPCGANVIKGTKGCRRHAGTTLAEAKAKGAVVTELQNWGLDGLTELADPGETLLKLVTQSAARCELYADLLRQAYEAAERIRADRGHLVDVDGEGADADAAREDLRRIFTTGGVAALVGNVYSATKDGDIYATGEAIRGLARLEAEERDRCASFAAKAVAAGIGERMVRLAERQGALLFAVIVGVLRAKGVLVDSAEIRELIGLHIAQETGVKAPGVIEGAAL